ncbi:MULTISPECIES: TetR/AcrR family transcriptional regulator [Streptomyces]|uniref:TetR/AcrR family transcriptional regulator n=1 Tax=Streptomyces TaxID=1883 RepID=UPI00325089D6|nr:TetR/AcrR family transcriptional regulator [Streptomyces phaeochromogenes]
MTKADSAGTRKRRQRNSINAEEILGGAFEVARGTSLDQLSMPILAEHLGVGVTSIYWYFRKKEELLNAMTDIAVDKYLRLMPEVRADDTWQNMLSSHFRVQREIHREDAVLSDLLLIRTSTYSREATRRIMELLESVVAKLVADGFTPDNAMMVCNAIGVYTRGSIIHERILRLANAPMTDPARQRRITDWFHFPVLDGLIDRHPISGTSDEDFEFSVARLMCGFEVLLSEQSQRPRKTSRGSTAARGTTTARKAPARKKAGS